MSAPDSHRNVAACSAGGVRRWDAKPARARTWVDRQVVDNSGKRGRTDRARKDVAELAPLSRLLDLRVVDALQRVAHAAALRRVACQVASDRKGEVIGEEGLVEPPQSAQLNGECLCEVGEL